MAELQVKCPACRHDVLVPDSLLGDRVQCPLCYEFFIAPEQTASGELGDSLPLDPQRYRVPPRSGLASRLAAPAILLLLLGLLGAMLNGFMMYTLAANPGQMIEILEKLSERQLTPEERAESLNLMRIQYTLGAGMAGITCLAALAMLVRRGFWLAVLGSVLAILNYPTGCCLPGIPLGIWSLIVLFNPDVKALFSTTSTSTESMN